jgi:hypothetical protein
VTIEPSAIAANTNDPEDIAEASSVAGSDAVAGSPVAAGPWTATPAEEERLAHHLSETARVRFAGEGEEHRVIRHAFPSKVLQLGILPALPQPDPGDPVSPEQLAQRVGQAPSTMGLDFRMQLTDGAAGLDIAGQFAFYVQRYPDRDEQAAFYSDEDALSREGDENEDADGQSATSANGAASGAGRTSGGSGTSSGGGTAGGGTAGATMTLMPKFERFDIEFAQHADIAGSRGELTFDLTPQVSAQLGGALTDSRTVYPFLARRGQTLDVAALQGDQSVFRAAIALAEGNARTTPHTPPQVTLTVAWQPDGEDTVRVQVTLGNATLQPQLQGRGGRSRAQQGGPRVLPRELALFNCRLRVDPTAGTLVKLRFHQAPEDFRYADTRHTWALGRSCVGRRDGDDGPLLSDTWPTYRQPRTVQNTGEHGELLLRFDELADPARMMDALTRVLVAMKLFDGRWQAELDAWTGGAQSKLACETARKQWQAEMAAYERGIDCLATDPELRKAFRAANEVFKRIGVRKGISSWRLFQVCFIVIQLAALRARRVDDPQLRAELDICDVLWAATGAGKTEGYLGLIVTSAFYDRWRGKHAGTTALVRYPLRMLSVQQLARIALAMAAAEKLRAELVDTGELRGDTDGFSMGYWAGFSNTPNKLSDDYGDGETTIEWWARTMAVNPKAVQDRRIISSCPHCGADLTLRPDELAVRLRYECTGCGAEAKVHMTDEEVYRAWPTVVICTVDKLARVAWAEEFVGLLAGPAYRCPDHGYFTWHRGGRDRDRSGAPTVKDRCAVGDRCTRPSSDYQRVGKVIDPAPSLIIQDELHLLEEELGTFDSHYETLMDLLWEELGDGLRPKMLAATATIEGGEAQVANLYARHIRQFPTQGWDRHTSFYATTEDDACRRLYVGALPNRPDVMEFGARAQVYFAAEVARLQAEPGAAVAALGYTGRDGAWMAELLARYELSLGYINRKENAGRIASVLRDAHHRGELPFQLVHEVLVAGSAGESSLADIAAVLDRIETQYSDGTPEHERLRALIATSLISHGVDLDRLNIEVMNRMTPTVAGYVQATSRAGRTHTGLVVVAFDRRIARERSFFGHFLDYHGYIDRLIAPVPVNRFARFAPRVTMPGLVCALVIHLFGREHLDATGHDPTRPMSPLSKRHALRAWWTGPAGAGAGPRLGQLVVRALGIGARRRRRLDDGSVSPPEALFSPVMEQWLAETAEREFDRQLSQLENWTPRDPLYMKLIPKPLQAFRSVDEPMDFRCLAAATDVQGDLTDPSRRPLRRRGTPTSGQPTNGSN